MTSQESKSLESLRGAIEFEQVSRQQIRLCEKIKAQALSEITTPEAKKLAEEIQREYVAA